MTTRTTALPSFAAHQRRNSRKVSSQAFFGSAAAASLLIGCAWTVYANVFAAGIYPSMSGGNFDAPVVRRSNAQAARALPSVTSHIDVALSDLAPVTVVRESAPKVAAATSSSTSRLSFEDRFGASGRQGVAPKPQMEIAKADSAPQVDAPKAKEAAPAQVAALVPMPSPRPADAKTGASVRDMAQRAKSTAKGAISVASIEKPPEKPSIFERLFGKLQSSGSTLAYASADVSSTQSFGGSSGSASHNIAQSGTVPLYDRTTAVYDISAHMVYLPDGTKLEAHSGLGSKLDDPSSANVRMRGVTPPHLYDLSPREALFHGVPALRLKPIGGEDAIFGRSGLLAHTYMLGPNGDSNGCVSFKDYEAFLRAYRNGDVKRLAVVAKLD